jgi:hypothetical protein
LKEKIQFADPIADVVHLLKRIYGNQATKTYIEKNFKNKIPELSYLFALQYLQDEPLDEIWSIPKNKRDEFPILSLLYLAKCNTDRTRVTMRELNTTKSCRINFMKNAANDAEIKEIKETNEQGIYLNYFIDTNRGIQFLNNLKNAVDDYFASIDQLTKPPYNLKRYNTQNETSTSNLPQSNNNSNDVQSNLDKNTESEINKIKKIQSIDKESYFTIDSTELQKNPTKAMESFNNRMKEFSDMMNQLKSKNTDKDKNR